MKQHTTPHHTTPHQTTPHHITPHQTTPHHITPHHTTSHHTTPHHTTPHHTTSHHTTPHHTTSHHTTPHHITPHHTTPQRTDDVGAVAPGRHDSAERGALVAYGGHENHPVFVHRLVDQIHHPTGKREFWVYGWVTVEWGCLGEHVGPWCVGGEFFV